VADVPKAGRHFVALARPSHDLPDSKNALQRAVGNQGMMRLANSHISLAPSHGTADTVAPRVTVSQSAPDDRIMRAPAEPYVRQINVDLNSPQNVTLDWQGIPPDEARSKFRCSTGKGYGDPDDPPGICNRGCCTTGTNPCASPFDQPKSSGSCCTPVGHFFIQSKEREHPVEGGTIPFWMYFYSTRGIAVHEYSPVDGTPLSHGCVRLDSVNAEMLFNHSYVNTTRVSVSGTATPACPTATGVACGKAAANEAGGPPQQQEASAGGGREETDAGA